MACAHGVMAIASSGRAAEKASCERTCLDQIADQYIAHDSSRVPIWKTAKFTENAQRLDVGDGL
jgi:hypothetical protein